MTEEMFEIPGHCPSCAGPTVEEGDFLYCRNKACPAKLSGDVKVWIRNLGILHWGEATIMNLTDPDDPKVSSVADLYRLSLDDLTLCCSGVKMARKLRKTLHDNTELPLELVLSSLNIPNFGLSTATDLVQAGLDSVDKVLSAGYDDFVAVPNVGEVTARQIEEGLLLRREILKDLATVVTIKKPVAGGPLTGVTVCITGDTSKPRKAVQKDIMDAGGVAKGSVSKDTTYLVTNDPSTATKKMEAAKKHGVKVIDEKGLYELIAGATGS